MLLKEAVKSINPINLKNLIINIYYRFLPHLHYEQAEIELTYNWDGDELGEGSRNFGHLAYRVDNIYETCQRLMDMGYTINRPPRDGHMAFVRSPDKISIEILQEGNLEPKEPWASMENTGSW